MKKSFFLFIFLVQFLLHSTSQECYDIRRDLKTSEEWPMLLDSLFHETVIDDKETGYAVLVLKVDSCGFVLSTHVLSSSNLDSTSFYKICSKIEDCYSYSFLIKEYQNLEPRYKKYISKKHLYLQYVYRFHPNLTDVRR